MPRIQDIKILDLEETTYYDRDDRDKKNPLPGCIVTAKFQGEKLPFTATLKKEHLELGVHRQLDDMRGMGKFVTMNLGAMSGDRGITWFFPSEGRGGVKPVLQPVAKPDSLGKPDDKKVQAFMGGKTGTTG
ncbi:MULTISPECIES: hypothetical protein [Methylomicrobium]|uniref:Uncharacterized protein n=1 Tax=Methylomicrobium album BG8 TaxID=686340 RepID=H8GQL4_METAL|nr:MULTISPECIES: hypothetical protein [Methylomicrobium]EIC29841.1 hypothetical protein Metal_2084 [Methylomicrobium album BG8]